MTRLSLVPTPDTSTRQAAYRERVQAAWERMKRAERHARMAKVWFAVMVLALAGIAIAEVYG